MVTTRKTAVLRTPALRQSIMLLLAFTMLTAPRAVMAQSLFNDQTSTNQNQQQGAGTATGTSPATSTTSTGLTTLRSTSSATTGTGTTTAETGTTGTVATPIVRADTDALDAAADGPTPLDEGAVDAEGPADETQPAVTFVNETPGIRIGTFTLRPSVTESINSETKRNAVSKTNRIFSETGIRGTLTSDWGRHALTVTGEGRFENGNGRDSDGPTISLGTDLRLDLPDETIANITTTYRFEREDETDPNAINGASTQSGVQQFGAGIAVQRDLGILRGTAALGISRTTYSGAELADGTTLDEEDRNRTGVDGRLRVGYELSQAFIPFLEVAAGLTRHDNKIDSSGYNRASNFEAVRAGVEIDLGEKLRGELALGHRWVHFDDDRLLVPGGFTADGTLEWSPQRGTDISLGLRTTLEESTTPGLGGWTQYELTSGINHRLRENLVARLTGSSKWREYPSNSTLANFVTYNAGAGLTWNINRYLDLDTDVTWETTPRDDTSELRVGAGLTLKR